MKFFRSIRGAMSAAIFLLCPLFSAARGQTPVYLSFHVPGSTHTVPMSINDSQTVTGYWIDGRGNTHGFLRYASGVIDSFDVPGSTYTEPVSINNAGQITGTYEVPSGVENYQIQQGFVRAPNGVITTFGNSSALYPQPVKINDSGEVAGNFPYLPGTFAAWAFIRSASGVEQGFTLPQGGLYATVATGLNDSGAVVGYSSNDSIYTAQGFVYPGKGPVPSPISFDYSSFTASSTATGTFPTSINASGAIAGCYSIGDTYYDFLRQANGTITTLRVPGTVPSCVVSDIGETVKTSFFTQENIFNMVPETLTVNDKGTVVGSYYETSLTPRGFIQTADGSITTFTDPEGTMTFPTGVNNSGDIIGAFSQGTTPIPFQNFAQGAPVEGFLRLPAEVCCSGAPVELTVEDPQGFFWDGGGSQWGGTILQVFQDYVSDGQNWKWTPVPGGFTVCTLDTVCLSDNGTHVVLNAKADVFTITDTGAVLDMSTGEYIQNASQPGNGAYLSTGRTASSWNFSFTLH